MAKSVPPLQIVIMLGKGTRPQTGAQIWMYHPPTCNFAQDNIIF